jgi:hypothetical protein
MTSQAQALMITEQVSNNTLKESTNSGDIAEFGALILPLIQKIYTDSLIGQIADQQPLNGPIGKVSALFSVYNGLENEPTAHPDNSFIVYLTTAPTGVAINDTITKTGGNTFKVLYIEDNKLLVVATTVGATLVKGSTLSTPVNSVTYATPNRAAIKKLFKRYSGTYAYGNDDNTSVKNISFETRTTNAVTVARKVKAKLSFEQIQDWVALYKEKGVEVATKAISTDIKHEIDKEFIDYLKFIAKYTVLSNSSIKLSNSIAATASGAMQDITSDIAVNIFTAAEQIVKDTRRNRTIFVIADPVTVAFLQVNALMTKADSEEENPYKVGKIGTYPLYCDLFAEVGEHYVLVGYQGSNEGDGDAGVIFAPYSNTLHAVDSADMKTNLLSLNRYAFVRHPQDTGNVNADNIWDAVNASNSDFFKMFIIDYGNAITNFTDTTLSNIE